MAREPFNDIWANNPASDQFEEPPSSAFETGWEGGADKNPPQAKWENWWHNRVDVALQDLERNGAMEWLSDVPYATWALARGSNSAVYIAVQDNEGFDPTIDDGSNWLSLTDFIKSVFNASGSAPVFAVRAWASYNGVSQKILGSGNVSNIARISPGRYQVTFETPMMDSNYAVTMAYAQSKNEPAQGVIPDNASPYDLHPDGFKIETWNNVEDVADVETILFSVVR